LVSIKELYYDARPTKSQDPYSSVYISRITLSSVISILTILAWEWPD